MATSAGGPDGAVASSMMLFHSPHAAHFPDQRAVTAPQAWQTKALDALAMMGLAAGIAPLGAGAEIGEDLVVDGAGVRGEVVSRDLLADQLHPGAALGTLLRHVGHIDGDEIH